MFGTHDRPENWPRIQHWWTMCHFYSFSSRASSRQNTAKLTEKTVFELHFLSRWDSLNNGFLKVNALSGSSEHSFLWKLTYEKVAQLNKTETFKTFENIKTNEETPRKLCKNSRNSWNWTFLPIRFYTVGDKITRPFLAPFQKHESDTLVKHACYASSRREISLFFIKIQLQKGHVI